MFEDAHIAVVVLMLFLLLLLLGVRVHFHGDTELERLYKRQFATFFISEELILASLTLLLGILEVWLIDCSWAF